MILTARSACPVTARANANAARTSMAPAANSARRVTTISPLAKVATAILLALSRPFKAAVLYHPANFVNVKSGSKAGYVTSASRSIGICNLTIRMVAKVRIYLEHNFFSLAVLTVIII